MKKGIFRTNVLFPTLVFAFVVWAYFAFFFDGHLRRGSQWAASRIHGAEVNIDSISTSFLHASLLIQGIAVTNKEKPEYNLFEIGEVHFQLVWDALLRMKAVINDASIKDIRANTKRPSPGFVLPPEPPASGGIAAKLQEELYAQTKKRLDGNFFGDLVNTLEGADPKEQLNEIKDDLKSTLRAEELKKEMAAKKAAWEERIKSLPKPQDLKALEDRMKALNLKGKNPLELAKSLKEAKSIVDEANQKVKQVEQSQKDFRSDLTNYTSAVSELEALAKKDVLDLQKRFRLPNLDTKEISTQIFMDQLEKNLGSVRKYLAIARNYMPPKKTKEQIEKEKAEMILPRERGQGQVFHFPITTGYPLFWLKHASISSEISQSEWAGKVSGELLDISTAPSITQKPMQALVKGSFPKKEISGLEAKLVMDHTSEVPEEKLRLLVGSFPVADKALNTSNGFSLTLAKATGSAMLNAEMRDESINFQLKSNFARPTFLVEAKNPKLQALTSEALKNLDSVSLQAEAKGKWNNLQISLDSDLGKKLSAAFEAIVRSKVNDAKGKLDSLVNNKLNPLRAGLKQDLAGFSKSEGSLQDRAKALAEAVKRLQEGAKGGGGGGGSLKDKLKGLGF